MRIRCDGKMYTRVRPSSLHINMNVILYSMQTSRKLE